MQRKGRVAVMALAACLLASSPVVAQPKTCAKADFEAVVDEAASALRTLNQQNTPPFQTKLRQLKEKRGWTHDQFMTEAAPFVRDETISGFDQKSEELLASITSGGQASSGGAPDCTVLAELRRQMGALVEAQKAKWAYMFGKLDKELAK